MRKFTRTQKEIKLDFIDKILLKTFLYKKPISNKRIPDGLGGFTPQEGGLVNQIGAD